MNQFEAETKYDVPTDELRAFGESLIAKGKVACLVLAGGQGSRLGTSHPKALTPVTAIRKKTLLQLICEKSVAASKDKPLQLAVMTSPTNTDAIAKYLNDHQNFGAHVSLFQQGNTPLLTQDHQPLRDEEGNSIEGPDGNGGALKHLMESGIGQKWKAQGIEYITVVPIDNPLADPFDASLCGYHVLKMRDVTIKAILRSDPAEKVGVIIRRKGKIAVQEYSELPPDFPGPLAHIGLFCFNLTFVEKAAKSELPWHYAHKIHHHMPILKPEKFLFDVLELAEHTGVVVYPREDVYAPLKNATGEKSLETVQKALIDFDKRHLGRLIQGTTPSHLFELDPALYYLSSLQKSDQNFQMSDYINA